MPVLDTMLTTARQTERRGGPAARLTLARQLAQRRGGKGGVKDMTPEQKALWEERFARAKEMKESGGKEIKDFMNMFDLQLGVLRQQQPGLHLEGLVGKLEESIEKARRYLGREMPYGITEQQWASLRETMGHAEEVVERYKAAFEQMRALETQEGQVEEAETAAGIRVMTPAVAANGAPAANGAAPAAAPPAAANGVTPAAVSPQAQVTNGAPAPAPAEGGFPTGLVVGGVVLTGLAVGSYFLFFRGKGKGKKKGGK
jgi:hypothetical protein